MNLTTLETEKTKVWITQTYELKGETPEKMKRSPDEMNKKEHT